MVLNGVSIVPLGNAQLSSIWIDSTSNNPLNTTDNVLLYAPSDTSLQNAQQLAAQLHTSSEALVLPGGSVISPDNNKHILVAYDASSNVNGNIQHAVNIADVDLVNMSADNQSSIANLNVYASDVVHLVGVSLASLTSVNINFIWPPYGVVGIDLQRDNYQFREGSQPHFLAYVAERNELNIASREYWIRNHSSK